MGLFSRNKKTAEWLAVDVQARGICVAQVHRPGVGIAQVKHAGGHQGDEDSIREYLRKVVKACGKGVRYSTLLSRDEYQFFPVEAPNVPADEMKTAISWQIKDMIDFPVEEATIDVLEIPRAEASAQQERSVFAVAAPSKIIEERQTLFGNAAVPLRVIDIPEMAQRNLATLLEEGRGVAMLSFDRYGGLLTLSSQGELYLARRLDIPIHSFETRGDDLNALFDRVASEIKRSLEHFGRQFHYVPIGKLVLAPMGPVGSALRNHLAEGSAIPVELFDMAKTLDVEYAPQLRGLDEQQQFFMAVGAALRFEEKSL